MLVRTTSKNCSFFIPFHPIPARIPGGMVTLLPLQNAAECSMQQCPSQRVTKRPPYCSTVPCCVCIWCSCIIQAMNNVHRNAPTAQRAPAQQSPHRETGEAKMVFTKLQTYYNTYPSTAHEKYTIKVHQAEHYRTEKYHHANNMKGWADWSIHHTPLSWSKLS